MLYGCYCLCCCVFVCSCDVGSVCDAFEGCCVMLHGLFRLWFIAWCCMMGVVVLVCACVMVVCVCVFVCYL